MCIRDRSGVHGFTSVNVGKKRSVRIRAVCTPWFPVTPTRVQPPIRHKKLIHYGATGYKRKSRQQRRTFHRRGPNLAYMIMASLDDEPLPESKLGTKQYWDNTYAYVNHTGFIHSLC